MLLRVLVLVLYPVLVASNLQSTHPVSSYHHKGCFNDGTIRVLPVFLGDFRNDSDPVTKCASATRKPGFRAFGVQAGGECWSGPRAHVEYNLWGKSTRCHGGVGGIYDNDVYFLSVGSVPCKVTITEHATPTCQHIREQDLHRNRTVFRLKPSPFGLYPMLRMTAEQLTKLLDKEPRHQEWMTLYKRMMYRNERLLPYLFYKHTGNMTFTTVAHYKALFKFMVEGQYKIIPPLFQKYFRFHFLRPGKPFKSFTTLCDWREDRIFAEQRLAGSNPLSILRASSWPGSVGVYWWNLYRNKLNRRFVWREAIEDALGSSKSFYSALYGGYVYVLSYPYLDGIPANYEEQNSSSTDRVLMDAISPIAVFVSKPSRIRGKANKLVPVAIQLGHTPESLVYTPDDGDMWLLAKQTVQVADFAQLGLVEHLLKLHMLMEPVCVCMRRHLHALHPLHQILKFHCRGVLGTTMFGGPKLLARNGTINRLMAIGLRGGLKLMQEAFKDLTWDDLDFKRDLWKRGMMSTSRIPYYPYRDDGLLIYEVIRAMASDYVDLYYKTDLDVIQDTELQNFAAQISADGSKHPESENGQIRGFPSSVYSRSSLEKILIRLIWATSAQHSVVNYPSNYYGLYTPNMPTKLYSDVRVGPGEFDIYNLPGKNVALTQAALGMNLASMFYDTLFDYSKELKDPRAAQIVAKYSGILTNDVMTKIEKRNRERYQQNHLPYPYLVPGWIANSIHT